MFEKLKGQSGQALVEFGLAIIPLLMFMLVTIWAGLLLVSKMEADKVARETAEMAGSVGAPTAEVWEYAAAQIDSFSPAMGDVQKLRMSVRDRNMVLKCGSNYPSVNTSCRADYGDWIEVEIEVEVETFFGVVRLGSMHRSSAWRASAP